MVLNENLYTDGGNYLSNLPVCNIDEPLGYNGCKIPYSSRIMAHYTELSPYIQTKADEALTLSDDLVFWSFYCEKHLLFSAIFRFLWF